MDGIINFHKPKGMTSHDVVYYFRRLLNIKKIGHGGTLDPEVAGVLPICIGKGTRVAEYMLEADKEYIGELNLNYSTDTQDSYGNILLKSTKKPSMEEISVVFSKFIGEIKQIPPMYSALKFQGKKLYELAREGKTIQREARISRIYELDIISIKDNSIIKFYVKCSKGTYIRTLCNDIARDLGLYGHMSNLIRIGVGNFNIKDSISMDYLNNTNIDHIKNLFLPIDYPLYDFDEIIVKDDLYNGIINGLVTPINENLNLGSLFKVYCRSRFIGIGEIIQNKNGKFLKMKKVLI